MPPKQTPQQAQEDILSQIENVKEPRTKRVYCEIFMDAPSKKEYPEYYAYIQRVICLNEIKASNFHDGRLIFREMSRKDCTGRGLNLRLMWILCGLMLWPLMKMEVKFMRMPRFSRYGIFKPNVMFIVGSI